MTEPEETAVAAGFWVRGGAFAVDFLLLATVRVIVSLGLIRYGVPRGVLALFGLALNVVYNGVAIGAWGRTLGKMAAGIKVVRADGSGALSRGQAWVRAFVAPFSGILLGLGYLAAAATSRKRALHDFAAGSVVVYPEPVGFGRRAVFAALGALVIIAPLAGGLWLAATTQK